MNRIIMYFVIFCMFSCSEDMSENNNQNLINIQLDLSQVSEYENDYSYTDFEVKVYTTKEDYFNEVNSIFTGNIDSSGKISISEGLESQSYYVDIYTEDKILSNWQVTDLDVDSSNIIVFYTGNNADLYNTVYIEDNRKFLGDWSFVDYDYINTSNEERTDKISLSINKDYTVQSNETYEGIAYVLNFEMLSNGYLNLINIEPSPDNYPVYQINPSGLLLQLNEEGQLLFNNYSGDFVIYTRN